MPNEADTCRKYVVPRLTEAGWDTDPHSIAEQRFFTDGRIVPGAGTARRMKRKKADYLLRYTRDFPIAVVEAKASYRTAGAGMQQAKEYAAILGLRFAYATNGKEILEFDSTTGIESPVTSFPRPDELWTRLGRAAPLTDTAAAHLLAPANFTPDNEPRYYQRVAIERAIRAILDGQRRVLLTMATGTGKTVVAFQICWKLWSSLWNRTGEHRKPRILYLADRNFLVDDPKDKRFIPFGDARWKIEGEAIKSREMYFATYQAIAKDERRPGLFKQYPRDFFDLIIVDECHRGSARDEWPPRPGRDRSSDAPVPTSTLVRRAAEQGRHSEAPATGNHDGDRRPLARRPRPRFRGEPVKDHCSTILSFEKAEPPCRY